MISTDRPKEVTGAPAKSPGPVTYRPLSVVSTQELNLELALRRGPRMQCRAVGCGAYDQGDRWNKCRSCGTKGWLTGGFEPETSSAAYQEWQRLLVEQHRGQVVEAAGSGAPVDVLRALLTLQRSLGRADAVEILYSAGVNALNGCVEPPSESNGNQAGLLDLEKLWSLFGVDAVASSHVDLEFNYWGRLLAQDERDGLEVRLTRLIEATRALPSSVIEEHGLEPLRSAAEEAARAIPMVDRISQFLALETQITAGQAVDRHKLVTIAVIDSAHKVIRGLAPGRFSVEAELEEILKQREPVPGIDLSQTPSVYGVRPAPDPVPLSQDISYKAALYDEVWEAARKLGFGNVTMILDRFKAAHSAYVALRKCPEVDESCGRNVSARLLSEFEAVFSPNPAPGNPAPRVKDERV
ncbi:hypothetical protein ACYSUW_13505 [Pseudomonas frederiksbergensis]